MIMKRQDIKKTNLKRNIEHYNYMGRVATPWFGKKKQRSYSHNLAFFHILRFFMTRFSFEKKLCSRSSFLRITLICKKAQATAKQTLYSYLSTYTCWFSFSFWNMPFYLFVSLYYLATYHHSIWSSRQKWVALNASDSNQNRKKVWFGCPNRVVKEKDPTFHRLLL